MPASIRSNGSSRSAQTDISIPGAVLVTKRDVAASLDAYENLLRASKQFRQAMQAASQAASAFAVALEDCARQKGASMSPERKGMADSQTFAPGESVDGRESPVEDSPPSERLMAAAGLHHLLGNHQHILSDCLYRQFEVPLLDEFDGHRATVAERQAAYEQATLAKTKAIRETEARNVKLGRKKLRDLTAFRSALSELQAHVDDLDQLKLEHYSEVLENEQEMWNSIANKTALIVKSEIDVFDRIVTKGSVDPVLESMQQANPDPFGAYAQEGDPSAIFSVLPSTSILSTAGPSSSRPSSVKLPSAGPSALPQVSASTAQAEPQRSRVERDQWTRPLSAISENTTKVNGGKEDEEGSEGDGPSEANTSATDGQDQARSTTAKSSDGPPVEGGSSTWAS